MLRRSMLPVGVLLLCVLVGLLALSASALAAAPEEPRTVSPAVSVTATSATLEGVLNPNAAGEPGEYLFLYRASASECTEGSVAPEPAGIALGLKEEAVSVGVSGLLPGTQYTFCLFERNAAEETAVGQPVTFTTLAVAPVVGEEFVTGVASDSATLQGEVNPGGAATTYHFDYGTTAAYGHSTAESASLGADDSSHPAGAHVQGLQPGTVYHYRLVATNTVAPGGVDGPDRMFTTQALGGGGLPDNRGYELVTPVDKAGGSLAPPERGGQISVIFGRFRASESGDGLAFTVMTPFPGAQSGGIGDWLASRNGQSWSSQALSPPQSTNGTVPAVAYSLDLSKLVLLDGGGVTFSQDSPPLVSGEPANNVNLFLRDNSTGSYQLMDLTPQGVSPAQTEFEGASTDLSHVVFSSPALLTPDAVGGTSELYQWTGGTVSLVSQVPTAPATSCGGSGPPCTASAEGGLLGPSDSHLLLNAVSNNGSRIFFMTLRASSGPLYVREDNTKTTLVGHGRFVAATPSGSKVFYVNGDLYEYDLESGQTSDLTPADNVLGVLGASDNGAYVYYVDEADRLSLWHEGVTTLIATLDPGDVSDWSELDGLGAIKSGFTARVTPDGVHLAFDSLRSLTGFDNRDAATGQPDNEVYFYDAGADRLVCASCDPSGARPIDGANILGSEENDRWLGLEYLPRNLSDDGSRLFFETANGLVPGDVNNHQDVYEYESGRARLISSGTSGVDSSFLDASPSGDDVFFETEAQLSGQDRDQKLDIYDARVGGGFPVEASTACTGAGCQGVPPTAPVFGSPASATFSGTGNILAPSAPAVKPKAKAKPVLCRKGSVRKKGKCVKKPRKAKKAKKAKGSRSSAKGRK